MREFNREFVPRPKGKMIKDLSLVDGPLNIEIGCGVGMHPIQFCQKYPLENLIAIEHTSEKYLKFERRVENHRLKNLFPIHANAISWIAHNIADEKVSRYILMYPNPNPKPGQKNKRWVQMPFFDYLIKTLLPFGEIIIVTNEKWYAEEVLTVAESEWNLSVQTVERKLPFKARTHFEKKYLERGQTCFEILLKKKGQHC